MRTFSRISSARESLKIKSCEYTDKTIGPERRLARSRDSGRCFITHVQGKHWRIGTLPLLPRVTVTGELLGLPSIPVLP